MVLKDIVFGKLLNLFRDSDDKQIKRFAPMVGTVNYLENEYFELTDVELKESARKFRLRHETGESLNDLLPEVFAATREAARRTIGLRHYDVQLIGGMVLHQGKVAEMKTGEITAIPGSTSSSHSCPARRTPRNGSRSPARRCKRARMTLL